MHREEKKTTLLLHVAAVLLKLRMVFALLTLPNFLTYIISPLNSSNAFLDYYLLRYY